MLPTGAAMTAVWVVCAALLPAARGERVIATSTTFSSGTVIAESVRITAGAVVTVNGEVTINGDCDVESEGKMTHALTASASATINLVVTGTLTVADGGLIDADQKSSFRPSDGWATSSCGATYGAESLHWGSSSISRSAKSLGISRLWATGLGFLQLRLLNLAQPSRSALCTSATLLSD